MVSTIIGDGSGPSGHWIDLFGDDSLPLKYFEAFQNKRYIRCGTAGWDTEHITQRISLGLQLYQGWI